MEVETVTMTNSALSPEINSALVSLSLSVSNAVDLAVQLAQRIGAHIASIRSSKEALRLSDVGRFLDEVTAESSKANEAPPWELITMFVQRIASELGALLPKVKNASKSGQMVSSEWLTSEMIPARLIIPRRGRPGSMACASGDDQGRGVI